MAGCTVEHVVDVCAAEESNKDEQAKSAASSSWEKPFTDTQAVEMSDYLLTEREAQAFLSEDEETPGTPEQAEAGPAWEHMWFAGYDSGRFPRNLQLYGPEAYGAYWEKWLEELSLPPPPGYYYMQNEAILSMQDAMSE